HTGGHARPRGDPPGAARAVRHLSRPGDMPHALGGGEAVHVEGDGRQDRAGQRTRREGRPDAGRAGTAPPPRARGEARGAEEEGHGEGAGRGRDSRGSSPGPADSRTTTGGIRGGGGGGSGGGGGTAIEEAAGRRRGELPVSRVLLELFAWIYGTGLV
ncbi:hypothetical protein THAOC_19443, partial [Thalassiosira oceanica]